MSPQDSNLKQLESDFNGFYSERNDTRQPCCNGGQQEDKVVVAVAQCMCVVCWTIR